MAAGIKVTSNPRISAKDSTGGIAAPIGDAMLDALYPNGAAVLFVNAGQGSYPVIAEELLFIQHDEENRVADNGLDSW